MDFHDFPRFLGKSEKYEIHPPKLCASLARNSDGGVLAGFAVEEASPGCIRVAPEFSTLSASGLRLSRWRLSLEIDVSPSGILQGTLEGIRYVLVP